MRSVVDRVTARALRRSLEPDADTRSTATELLALANDRRWVIERALTRVQAAQAERVSVVGERARLALVTALAATPTFEPLRVAG